ncbi:MAG: mechanosensitive ion channel family protein [Gemmatimonadetes bacterium]|nr:mechanosensitive ion channel family protein [Gemmatimonadota bacterium]
MSWTSVLEVAHERIQEWIEGFVDSLPNLVAALLVLAAFYFLARVVRSLTERLFGRLSHSVEIAHLLSRIAYLAVLAGGTFLALEILQLEKTVTSLLAGVGIVGLALGFAFQDLAANFMSGILIAVRRPYETGDVIETHDVMGTVEETTLRATRIRNFRGQLVRVPNRKVIENPITNYSQSGVRRIDVDVGVAYGDDLERARDAALEAVRGLELRNDEEPAVYFERFGHSAVEFSVRFWIDYPDTSFLEARSRAVLGVKRALDEAGCTIPFPIRTLDLGGSGGVSGLREILDAGREGAAYESRSDSEEAAEGR